MCYLSNIQRINSSRYNYVFWLYCSSDFMHSLLHGHLSLFTIFLASLPVSFCPLCQSSVFNPFLPNQMDILGLCGKVWYWWDCRHGLYEQSPASARCQIRASSTWIQKGHTTSQSWATGWRWLYLCESGFKKGKNVGQQKLGERTEKM